ncbi:MAG: hypothetical protein ACRC76_08995 [Proteocatella sp.]
MTLCLYYGVEGILESIKKAGRVMAILKQIKKEKVVNNHQKDMKS